jgi:hypothetical protein
MSGKKEEVSSVFEGIDFGDLTDTGDSIETQILDETPGAKDVPSVDDFLKSLDKEIEKTPSSTSEGLGEKIEVEKPGEELGQVEKTKEIKDITSSSTLNALLIAKAFSEGGGFSEFDEEEFKKVIEEKGNTPEAETEALMEFIQKEVDANADAKNKDYISSLTPEKRAEAEAIEQGIDPAALQLAENDIRYLTNTDPAKLDDAEAEKILRYHMKLSTGYSDAKIDKEIKRSKDLGELVEDATEAIPEITSIRKNDILELKDQAVQNKTKVEEKETARVAKIKETVAATTEILGKKLTKPSQAKIQDMILKPSKTVNGRTVNAVWAKRHDMGEAKFDTILAGLIMNGAFDGKVDIGTKAKTKAFQDLTAAIKTGQQASTSSFGYNDGATTDSLKEMKSAFE